MPASGSSDAGSCPLQAGHTIVEVRFCYRQGNQSRIFIRRTDAEVETPILCPPDAKNRLIRKDPDAGED